MELDLKEKVQKQEEKKASAKVQLQEKVGAEDKMSRPCKRRRVQGRPNSSYFKPSGIRKIVLEEIELSLEEFEAIRLKDKLNLDQKECAEKMNISQPTFHRLINSARNKIARAIVEGLAIKINITTFK